MTDGYRQSGCWEGLPCVRVDDLARELSELRSHGGEIMEYDTLELKTENGIVDTGGALHPWIVAPARTRSGSTGTSERLEQR